jgi:hypothetical protein
MVAAKQALLQHSFMHARALLTQAIAAHPSYKVGRCVDAAAACACAGALRARVRAAPRSSWLRWPPGSLVS